MPKTLTIYRFSEKLPEHRQAILYFDVTPECDGWYDVEPYFVLAERCFVKRDAFGMTSISQPYKENEETPEDSQLFVQLVAPKWLTTPNEWSFWCPMSDIRELAQLQDKV